MIYLAGTDFSHLTNDELIKGIKALDLPDYIRSKACGIDVRETLAQMTEMTIQLGVNMGLSPDEALKWARKLQESVSQSEFDSWVATLLDGGPSIFMNTLSELQTTYPNGAAGVALVRETDPAKIYVWNGTAWEDFGVYQGIELKDGTVTTSKIAKNNILPVTTSFAVGGGGVNLWDGVYHPILISGNEPHEVVSSSSELSIIVKVEPQSEIIIWKDTIDFMTVALFDNYPFVGSIPTHFANANGRDSYTTTTGVNTKYIVAQVSRSSNIVLPNVMQVEIGSNKSSYIAPNSGIVIDLDKKSLEPALDFLPVYNKNTTSNLVADNYGGKVTWDGDFITPTELNNGEYIFSEYRNLEVGENYTVIFETDATEEDVKGTGTILRFQKRIGTEPYESIDASYVSEGVFMIKNTPVTEAGVYRIMAWNYMAKPLVVNKILVGKNGVPSDRNDSLPKNVDEIDNVAMWEVRKNIDGSTDTLGRDYLNRPLYPVWGHEYMYSWYKKIVENADLTMVWGGDSTTLGTGVTNTYNRRSNLGKKIMTLGGYADSKIETINSGQGSQHTGNWLGGDYDDDKRTPNGFLYEDMQKNPDLYVLAYGINDGSMNHFPGITWQERVSGFEERLNIGLERIRGSMYNKSADDMAIIICTPSSTDAGASGQTNAQWQDRIRPIIEKACRKYHCAFVDIGARQYDHEFSHSWGDTVHPNDVANLDYMSMFADLLFPYLMHK